MKTSEMKNTTTGGNGLNLNLTPQDITTFNNSFNINTDSEKHPSKILSTVLNNVINLKQSDRKTLRADSPMFEDYRTGGQGDNKDELNISKINADITKLCTQSKEIKTKEGKPTGLYLIPFKIANNSYCWSIISKDSLAHQLKNAKGEKIAGK